MLTNTKNVIRGFLIPKLELRGEEYEVAQVLASITIRDIPPVGIAPNDTQRTYYARLQPSIKNRNPVQAQYICFITTESIKQKTEDVLGRLEDLLEKREPLLEGSREANKIEHEILKTIFQTDLGMIKLLSRKIVGYIMYSNNFSAADLDFFNESYPKIRQQFSCSTDTAFTFKDLDTLCQASCPKPSSYTWIIDAILATLTAVVILFLLPPQVSLPIVFSIAAIVGSIGYIYHSMQLSAETQVAQKIKTTAPLTHPKPQHNSQGFFHDQENQRLRAPVLKERYIEDVGPVSGFNNLRSP